jgi:hypothetical protein
LKSEKVEEILAETTRLWQQVGLLLDRPGLTHDQGMQLFRTALAQSGPLFVEIFKNRVARAIPERWHKYIATDAQLDTELEKVSTRKKWKAILEGSDVKLDEMHELVKVLRGALPRTKKELRESISKLRGESSGRKPKLSFVQRQEIRAKIRKRLGPRVHLKDLYDSLAPSYGVEAITIKRVWLSEEADDSEGE